MNISDFEYGFNELKISKKNRVGIIGVENWTYELITKCISDGYAVEAIFSLPTDEQKISCPGIPNLPHTKINKVNPDALILSTRTCPRKVKDIIYNLSGPNFKGLTIVSDFPGDIDYYNQKHGSLKVLENMKDCHKGERAFVIGNGPSLMKTNPLLLSNEITFASNAIYLIEGFEPTYYFVEDKLVAEQRKDKINSLPWEKFFPKDFSGILNNGIFFNVDRVQWINFFSTNFAAGMEMNATVTFTMLQAAFYFGCDPVYLIGVDHEFIVDDRYVTKNGSVLSFKDGADPNHFHPNYYSKGTRWYEPRIDRLDAAYRLAAKAFESHNRKCINATDGGQLDFFERCNFSYILS